MRISNEYAEVLYKDNQRLAREIRKRDEEIKRQNEDIEFLKKCLYMALRSNNAIVLSKDFDEIVSPEFKFEENIGGEPILKAL